jgi:hypothetical protein
MMFTVEDYRGTPPNYRFGPRYSPEYIIAEAMHLFTFIQSKFLKTQLVGIKNQNHQLYHLDMNYRSELKNTYLFQLEGRISHFY